MLEVQEPVGSDSTVLLIDLILHQSWPEEEEYRCYNVHFIFCFEDALSDFHIASSIERELY